VATWKLGWYKKNAKVKYDEKNTIAKYKKKSFYGEKM